MIACLHYPAPQGAPDILLVMLPGAGIAAADFAANGMVAAVQSRHPEMEVTVAHPDIGLYLEDGVTSILHTEVIAPALARGISRIWLLGISLGGMGALLYASAHTRNIEGLLLIAPFIGTRGTTAEILHAGGIPAWSPQNTVATAPEQFLLAWLQTRLAAPALPPLIYLGYAAQDRFAPAHKLLAQNIPAARIATAPGGHDWPAWRKLWDQLLALAPFAGRCHAE